MVSVAQAAEHRVVAPAVEGSSPFTHPISLLRPLQRPYVAPVAQLDRAPDFESVGRPFESGRACQIISRPLHSLTNVHLGDLSAF
jgi:hypothetical protein